MCCLGSSRRAASRMRKLRVMRPTIFGRGRGQRGASPWHGGGSQWRSRCISSLPPPRPPFSIPSKAARWRASAPMRCASAMASSHSRCPTSSLCVAILPTSSPAPAGSVRRARQFCCVNWHARGDFGGGGLGAQAAELKLYKKIATMDATAPLPALHDQTPTWNTAAELARQWDLDRLARRLEEITTPANRVAIAGPTVKAAPRRQTSEQILKIATFNINNVNRRLANSARLAERVTAQRGLPPGAQVDRRCVSRSRNPGGRLARYLARSAHL